MPHEINAMQEHETGPSTLDAEENRLQAQIIEIRKGFQRHEMELQEWASWRQDVDSAIEELRILQRQVATKEDLHSMERRLHLAADTVPAPVAIFFGGSLMLLAVVALIAHLF